ncbi:Serine-threonine/tyrosine-protein kinase, catalytic domain [Sesbania bispinosa]|nr:Serine-threonine/tyrosine-protein kinase, catalytic domain [Sesbania bispinosa]
MLSLDEMSRTHLILIIGICIGFVVGVGLVFSILFCFRCGRKRTRVEKSSSQGVVAIPVQVKGVDSSTTLSDSNVALESPRTSEWSNMPLWLEGLRRKNVVSACGIPKYSYKDIQKATSNFTTIIGHGAFGPVYKAQMSADETFAVKVLGTNSRQGEQEFLTEVLLLGRLHHRNLVGLVGYAAERGQHMLLYIYMSNGSLASHLYGKSHEPLSWDLRLSIALDVARGLEYLHYGAAPPVVHRDIKSSNILLDQYMRAKITDLGLSRPEMITPHTSNAAMESEGKVGWEEIVDSQLNRKYDVHKLNDMASLALKCVNGVSKIRPSMRDIVQALSQLCKKHSRKDSRASPAALKEVSIEVGQLESHDFSSIDECSKVLRRLHSR